MLTSSTLTFSMGSGERKRCSNMAPVRRLRNLAWMKARRLPGVRCSTLNTECRSLLCLMIMPGRSWVAGMAMGKSLSLHYLRLAEGPGSHDCESGANLCILYGLFDFVNQTALPPKSRLPTNFESKTFRSCASDSSNGEIRIQV